MKSGLLHHVMILYVAEQACWTWYKEEIEETTSPQYGLTYSLRMVDGWRSEKHLWNTMAPLADPDKLSFMDIPMGESIWEGRALCLMWHITMRRAWSLSKHSAPPGSLANLFSPSAARRDSAAK